MAIDRPDWSPQGGDRALVSTALRGQTTGGNNAVVASGDGVSYSGAGEAPIVAEERDLSDAQEEMAGAVGDQLLMSCPDPEGMEEALEDLSDEAINLLGYVLATKMPRTPLDVIFDIEDKATLARTLEIKQWYFGLPDHLKAWIEGDGNEW
jgi:hypothetical protein